MTDTTPGDTASLINRLKDVLSDLQRHPYPVIPSPPDVKKRASVALIIRINPSYSHWPTPRSEASDDLTQSGDDAGRLTRFFGQDWVQNGAPEVLFIKRASRKGDRWTGHVALPGGRRDPEDVDDKAAAVRETWEEVGIELSSLNAVACGNLPQRLVTTNLGKVPLMILCPYVFLLTTNDLAPLKLQPTEIASTHWVPMNSLLSSEMRTYEYQDVTNRLAKQEFGIKRRLYQLMLGKMMFSAVRLIPSESRYCTSATGYGLEKSRNVSAVEQTVREWLGMDKGFSLSTDRPLLLWGLTLGVVGDFLDFLPPYNALCLWSYPTFSPPDVRLIIWVLSYGFRKRKQDQLSELHTESPAMIEIGLDSVPMPRDSHRISEGGELPGPPEAGISGLGVGREHERHPPRRRRGSRSSRVGFMIDGYYEIIRKSVAVTVLARAVTIVAATLFVLQLRRRARMQ